MMPVFRYDISACMSSPSAAAPLFSAARQVANGRYKDRLAPSGVFYRVWCEGVTIPDLARKRWRIWTSGGGVRRRSGSRLFTSVLGMCWFASAANRLHVRVIGDRVPAPMSDSGDIGPDRWGVDWLTLSVQHPLAVIYPALSVSADDEAEWDGSPVPAALLRKRPWDGDLWSELGEWVARNVSEVASARVEVARKVADRIEDTFLGPAHPEYVPWPWAPDLN